MSYPNLFTLIVALALASFVNASPIQKGEDNFSIQQVQNAIQLRNGPEDMVKTLQKFGHDVPEHIQVAAVNRAATAGSVPANPSDEYDSAYVCPVVVGNGTTLIYIDDSIVESYYSKIPGAELNQSAAGYIFPCSATPPDFSIFIEGATQTVPGKYINYSPTDQGSSMCFGGIQSNAYVGLTIFGNVFLKSTYVVFMDPGSNPRLGFAKQA